MTGFIEEANRQGLLYLMLGSIITSDNSDEENRIALTLAEDILSRIVETSFPDERKEYVRKFAEDAIGILEKELEKYNSKTAEI